MLALVSLPAGMDDAETRSRLLNEYNIEVGAGLGWLKGRYGGSASGKRCSSVYPLPAGCVEEILA
jgi:alanine-glyoxylate transaminase/serine-glyoxylate transaminase/serine-pyruvate transaminase